MLKQLYATLARRATPEEVARLLLEADSWTAAERKMLAQRARPGWYTYMRDVFHVPTHTSKSPRTLARLLNHALRDANDPRALDELLAVAREHLHLEGPADYRRKRKREEMPAHLSWRNYKRLYRLVVKVERESAELSEQQLQASLFQTAKSAFASTLHWRIFRAHPPSAQFVAYYTANLNRRSVFTSGPQARAFDAVAKMLLKRALDGRARVGAYAIAHVFPRFDVLERLKLDDLMVLLGRANQVMRLTAERLRRIAGGINLKTMLVHRGNDSSTWNELAGAWNKARDFQIALLQFMGLDSVFDTQMTGKVMRLMAADVACGLHGGRLHPDTDVFAALPKPWEVLLDNVPCHRALIEQVCHQHGVDPQATGWSVARPRTYVEAWSPTPELVHGVVVHHPELAEWLRQVGVFSGQSLNVNRMF